MEMDHYQSNYKTINPEQIKPALEKLGYSLIDRGNYWHTKALYRGGDNPTALCIYKDNGRWIDFAHDNRVQSFLRLVKLTTATNPYKFSQLQKSLDYSNEYYKPPKILIEMDEIYPESMLEKLFPNYNFYKQKNITESTQRAYKCGIAGAGKLYRRTVFPIYNNHSQIVGFSGRKIDNDNENAPKWKHIGKKKNWVYPAFLPSEETVDSIIRNKKEVFLVESIGDSMALFDSGVKANLVTFGLGVSSSIITYLSSISLKRIVIAANNDKKNDKNNGIIGAIKSLSSLSIYFDFNKIEIRIPPDDLNDWADAKFNNCDLKNYLSNNLDREKMRIFLISFISNNKESFSEKDLKQLRKILQKQ